MKAFLMVSLGTPEQPTAGAVRRFLRPFLGDARVVELPRLLWLPILYCFVLPFRPARVARLYQSIWTATGSPLRSIARAQTEGVRDRCADLQGLRVAMAFTYGEPSIAATLDELQQQGCDEIVVLPLYPQYSCSTTAAVYDQVAAWMRRRRRLPTLRLVSQYHLHPLYISALADSVRNHWQVHGRGDRLLMSWHGTPESYARRGDPYKHQCQETSRALAAALELRADQHSMSFQSRFGPDEWLQPYTDETVQNLARQGIGTLDVVCPGFSADCLETLEEIAGENAELFREAGGTALRLVPCLNADSEHLDLLAALVRENLANEPQDTAAGL